MDSNARLAWLFDETGDAEKLETRLAQGEPVAPWLWRLEVVNVILVKERRKLVTIAQAINLLELLDDWSPQLIGETNHRSLTALAALGRPYQLTAYDAVYLDLAMTLSLPLFTLDKNLRAAAVAVGVALIEF